MKDSKGFMWFGTNLGLNRYDGRNFKVFYSRAKDTTTLINNDIVRIMEDPKGRLWINTIVGLNIYDPEKESFSRNPLQIAKEYGLPKAEVSRIVKDSKNNFLFVTPDEGVFRYSSKTRLTTAIPHRDGDPSTLSSKNVTDLGEDKAGFYWAVHKNGMIEKLDPQSLSVVYRSNKLNQLFGNTSMDYGLTIDSDGDLWISVFSYNKGVFFFKNGTGELRHLDENSKEGRLNTSVVRGVVEDDKGMIWIATDHGGINLLNKQNFVVTYIRHNPDNNRSLSDNSAGCIYKDNTGIIWLGTFKKGIDYYHENLLNFNLVRHSISSADGVNYNDTNCFAEDDKGNLWVGSNEGGLCYYDRTKNQFTYFNKKENPDYPSSVIVSLLLDRKNNLWIGTYYGGLYKYDGKKFTKYGYDPANPAGISSDNIWKIHEDKDGNLWIGTLGEGLEMFDQKNRVFRHFKWDGSNSVHNSFISTIIEDKDQNIWIGTSYGIDVLDKNSNRFIHYLSDIGNPKTIPNNSIVSIIQDKRGFIWVGTKEGLSLLDKNREVIRTFTVEDGMGSNQVISMIEDTNGNLWVGTSNGLSNIVIDSNQAGKTSFTIRNYNERDGLQGKYFNENAAFKTRKGELVFGGPNGFNIFRPSDVPVNKSIPMIVFSELQVFNKEVKPNEKVNGRVILEKSILDTKELVLKSSESVFSVNFAALNFFHPEKNKYAYKLEGFDDNWTTADEKLSRITYTNLNPGEYILKVRASNNDGYWNNAGANLKVIILPPFWKTNWAFGLYIFILLLALYIGREVIIERARLRFAVEQERREIIRIHEVDMMKTKFFTNISHEFRTPLTLILTPLDKILNEIRNEDQKKHLQMMQRNAKRLMNLVNQLLDFRKIEVQEIKLSPSNGEIISFIKDTCFSFSDVSEKKNIHLSFNSTISNLETAFDWDKLERILFNLLSNAFKFTPEGGSITVSVDYHKGHSLDAHSSNNVLEIRVKDTGIGIPQNKKELIFERFFQNETPGNLINQGSGIGLAITKEFVQLHGGKIFVESEGVGSTFVIILPIESATIGEKTREIFEESRLLESEPKHMDYPELDSRKQTLLLVEDNEDFRFYLKDNLKSQFNILEAANGKIGWEIASSQLPDLIVSDVMMPEMNGLQLSKKVRGDMRTSHIPVVLLTARGKEEQKIEGYNSGASEYITKPFNYEILLSRIRNLIAEREVVKKSFQKNIEIAPSTISITSLDQKLVAKAIQLVESNIANANFSVEEMGRELGMSRAHLYKKILALTGKTPIEFIRMIRIKRAAQLLEKSQLTVSEVAYEVGINNLKYFAKYFKAQFDILPSQYAKKFKES
jgi:signal transduction histidine kinase/ligand-binding sensor domain-containing protein/DNA-binding response OmpR family regulator